MADSNYRCSGSEMVAQSCLDLKIMKERTEKLGLEVGEYPLKYVCQLRLKHPVMIAVYALTLMLQNILSVAKRSGGFALVVFKRLLTEIKKRKSTLSKEMN